MPIFDGQLSAIAAELEGCDPEECQIQVGSCSSGCQAVWGAQSCALVAPVLSPVMGCCACAQSRIYNLEETKVIRDLNPADINKLISVSGMVTRTSGVIPDQRCGTAQCVACVFCWVLQCRFFGLSTRV